MSKKDNTVRAGAIPESADPTVALNRLIAKKEEEIAKLLEQNQILQIQKDQLEGVVKGVLGSKSWKITAVPRGFAEQTRKLWPFLRFRRHRFEISPLSNIQSTDDDSFEIVGPSATLSLLPDGTSGSLPSGWVSVSAKLASEMGHMFFLLHYRTSKGFSSEKRFWLSFESGSSQSTLIRLPEGIREFRLDPFEREGVFSLRDFEIRELGTLQVGMQAVQKQLGPVLSDPMAVWGKLKKAYALFRNGGFAALRIKLFSDTTSQNYQEWVTKYDTLTDRDRSQIRSDIEDLKRKPLISVLMPTYNTPPEYLKLAIESVKSQLYQNWELCISDDCSTREDTRALLESYRDQDPRIRVHVRLQNGHISEASNSCLQMAKGELVALLDHDDELTEHALYMVVSALNRASNGTSAPIRFFYSDEDKKTSFGMRFNPYFKGDWSPELLLSQNYICHLSVFDRELVNEVGGFRKGFEGAQDWDLVFRVSERLAPEQICHIPHILYHWRVIEGSTAQATAHKPYVMEAQRKAVQEHLSRLEKNAVVSIREDISQIRVKFLLAEEPKVSIIIPTKDQVSILRTCVKSIFDNTSYQNFEILILNNRSEKEETQEYLSWLQQTHAARVINDERDFNFSRINNFAVEHATGDVLAFLNNDMEVISADWLTEMVSYAEQPEIGAVGARLLYPNRLLQHGGVVLGIGGVGGHSHKGCVYADPGYFNKVAIPQNFSAVTAACLVTRRSVFEEIGGFNEKDFAVAFNDVDLCLRIREKGYRIVYTPYAELYHHESISRGYETTPEKFQRFESEIELMKKKWGSVLARDPYYNPNLTLLSENYALGFPPRAIKPWR